MNPVTRNEAMIRSNLKARRLEADVARMSDVLGLINHLAEGGREFFSFDEILREIARLSRAALAGATPPDV